MKKRILCMFFVILFCNQVLAEWVSTSSSNFTSGSTTVVNNLYICNATQCNVTGSGSSFVFNQPLYNVSEQVYWNESFYNYIDASYLATVGLSTFINDLSLSSFSNDLTVSSFPNDANYIDNAGETDGTITGGSCPSGYVVQNISDKAVPECVLNSDGNNYTTSIGFNYSGTTTQLNLERFGMVNLTATSTSICTATNGLCSASLPTSGSFQELNVTSKLNSSGNTYVSILYFSDGSNMTTASISGTGDGNNYTTSQSFNNTGGIYQLNTAITGRTNLTATFDVNVFNDTAKINAVNTTLNVQSLLSQSNITPYNVTTDYFTLKNPPSACIAGTWLTYWRGNDSTCTGLVQNDVQSLGFYNSTYSDLRYLTATNYTVLDDRITVVNNSLQTQIGRIDALNSSIINKNLSLDNVTNPTTSKLFNFANFNFNLSFNQGTFFIEQIGAFTNDVLHIHQHTGNPSAGSDLVHLEAEDGDVTGLNITTVGESIVANNNITTAGWFKGKLNYSDIQNHPLINNNYTTSIGFNYSGTTTQLNLALVGMPNLTATSTSICTATNGLCSASLPVSGSFQELNVTSKLNSSGDTYVSILYFGDGTNMTTASTGGGGNVTGVNVSNSSVHAVSIMNSDGTSVSTSFVEPSNNYISENIVYCTDFTASSANSGFPVWSGAAHGSGASLGSMPAANIYHPGVIALNSGSASGSGYRFLTGSTSISDLAFRLNGSESTYLIYRLNKENTVYNTTTGYFGWVNTLTATLPSAGVYIWIQSNTTNIYGYGVVSNGLSLNTSVNSSDAYGGSFDIVLPSSLTDVFYKSEIIISEDFDNVTFNLYNSTFPDNSLIWTGYISNTSVFPYSNATNHGIVASSTRTGSNNIVLLDKMCLQNKVNFNR